MPSVPFIFATQTGNIPLSELDSNFAFVANLVPDYANTAGIANTANVAVTAGTVTNNAQGNITSLGTLTSLTSTGNIVGLRFIGNGALLTGIATGNAAQLTGNTLSANVINSSLTSVGTLSSLSVTGAVIGGNLTTSGFVSALGDVTAGNLVTTGVLTADGNVIAGNVLTAGQVSATGNITGADINAGNLFSSGAVSATGNATVSALLADSATVANIDINGGTISVLGTTGNINAAPAQWISVNTEDFAQMLWTSNIANTDPVAGGNLYIRARANAAGFFVESQDSTDPVPNYQWNFTKAGGNLSTTGNIIAGNALLAGDFVASDVILADTRIETPTIVVNTISSDDSTAVTVGDDLVVQGDVQIDTQVQAASGSLALNAATVVQVTGGAVLRLPSLTSAQIANVAAANGDMVYNTTLAKFQGFENGSWANLI